MAITRRDEDGNLLFPQASDDPDIAWQMAAARGGFANTELANDGTTNHFMLIAPGDNYYDRLKQTRPDLIQADGTIRIRSNELQKVIPEIGQANSPFLKAPLVAMALMGGAAAMGAGSGAGATSLSAGSSGLTQGATLASEAGFLPGSFELGAGAGLDSAITAGAAGTGATGEVILGSSPLESIGTGAFDMGGATGSGVATGAPGANTVTGWTVGPGQTAAGANVAAGGGATTGSFFETLVNNAKTGITNKLSDPFTLGQNVLGIIQSQQAASDAEKIRDASLQGLEASDPFAAGRKQALEQYLKYVNDPTSYFASPLAQAQITEMNRAVRAKQSQLGQTWNIDPATGQIRGSGGGATDFANTLQANTSKMYLDHMNQLANQAGMPLFPNPGFVSAANTAQNTVNQQNRNTFGGYGMLIGAGRELFPEISKSWGDRVKSIFGA